MITHLTGSAIPPRFNNKPALLFHVCNDIGGWGAGFTGALSSHTRYPEVAYRSWASSKAPKVIPPFSMGQIQAVFVCDMVTPHDLYVVNAIAQSGIRSKSNPRPLSYEALEACLRQVIYYVKLCNADVHMPRIGAGLAGGDWDTIEQIVAKTLKNCEVYVYTLRDQLGSYQPQ